MIIYQRIGWSWYFMGHRPTQKLKKLHCSRTVIKIDTYLSKCFTSLIYLYYFVEYFDILMVWTYTAFTPAINSAINMKELNRIILIYFKWCLDVQLTQRNDFFINAEHPTFDVLIMSMSWWRNILNLKWKPMKKYLIWNIFT